MNVGSILNNDSPPDEQKGSSQADSTTHQRHSIVNILNEPVGDESFDQSSDKIEDTSFASRKSSVSISEGDFSDVDDKPDEPPKAEVIKQEEVKSQEKPIEKVPNQSTSKKNIPNDLAKIKQITRKPRRYETPPIWAQEYKPVGRRGGQNYAATPNEPPIQGHQSVLSDKHALNFTSTPSVDLECSVTGIIPTSSMTKTISGWIFANFKNIPEESRKHVELELKFGRIIDKSYGKRLNLDITSECVYTKQSNTSFDMQIEDIAWNDITKLLQNLEYNYQNDLKKSKNSKKPQRKFNVLEVDTTDSFYYVGERNEKKKIRVSKDNTLDTPRYSAINKHRIGDLYIYNPTCIYDLRLSLSLELPVPDESIEGLIARNQPHLVREKKRTSWVHVPTITRFDLTRVLIPMVSKNKAGKTITSHEKNYEIELEIDSMELFSAIDKVDKGTDMFRFEELVEVFMNNARVLNNRVSSLARSEH